VEKTINPMQAMQAIKTKSDEDQIHDTTLTWWMHALQTCTCKRLRVFLIMVLINILLGPKNY
jgi:hypothetical protein